MQLVTSKKLAQFRGPSMSKDINELIDNMHYDLTQLLGLANKHKVDIPNNQGMLMNENLFLNMKISALEQALSDIIATISGTRTLTHTFTSSDNIVSSSNVDVDTTYGIAYRDIQHNVSKVYLKKVDTGDILLPKSLGMSVYESTSPFSDITADLSAYEVDEDLTGAINGDSAWQRVSVKSAAVSDVYAVIKLTLPQNIVNHMRVNSISLIPSPQFAYTLLDIQYKNGFDWFRLPTYPTHEVAGQTVPDELTEFSSTQFTFPYVQATEIVIYLKQSNYIESGGDRLFIYGFRNIGVSYTRFDESSTCTVRVKFDIPNPSDSFQKITSITPMYGLGGIATGVSLKLYLDDSTTTETPLNTVLPVGTKSVYIEATIECGSSGISPLLNGIRMAYTTI